MSSPSGAILTGARAAVAALEDAGVSVAFGLPGVHNLPLWRELNGSPIRLVGVRHEQTAAYAADGYARASGRRRRGAHHDRARARPTRSPPWARPGRRASRSW